MPAESRRSGSSHAPARAVRFPAPQPKRACGTTSPIGQSSPAGRKLSSAWGLIGGEQLKVGAIASPADNLRRVRAEWDAEDPGICGPEEGGPHRIGLCYLTPTFVQLTTGNTPPTPGGAGTPVTFFVYSSS